ncbi:MAG: hypothetical protein PHV06_01560, partial [bacterium]|nr:hypothetical protein [bacterium]
DFFASKSIEKYLEVSSSLLHIFDDLEQYIISNEHGIYYAESLAPGHITYFPFFIPGIRITDLPKETSELAYRGFIYVCSDKGLFVITREMIQDYNLLICFDSDEALSLNKIIKPIYQGHVYHGLNLINKKENKGNFLFCSHSGINYFESKEFMENKQNIKSLLKTEKPVWYFNVIDEYIFISYYPQGFEVRKFNTEKLEVGERIYLNKDLFIIDVAGGKNIYKLYSEFFQYKLDLNSKRSKLKKEKDYIKPRSIEAVVEQDYIFPYGDIYSFNYSGVSNIGTWNNGIFHIDNENNAKQIISNGIVTGIINYKDKVIYSTWDGKIGFFDYENEAADEPVKLMNNIYSLKLARDDNLFICGKGKAKVVNLERDELSNSIFTECSDINIPSKFRETEILAMGEWRDEENATIHFLFGTYKKGIIRCIFGLDGVKWDHLLEDESVPVIEDEYGRLFISTGKNIFEYDGKEFKDLNLKEEQILDMKFIAGDFKRILGQEMFEFKSGEKEFLVVSGAESGLTVYDLKNNESLSLPIFAKKIDIDTNEERLIPHFEMNKSFNVIRKFPEKNPPDKPYFKIIAAEEYANEIRVWKIGIY